MLATAIHTGHDLRPEVAGLVALDDATRLREEDPFTDVIAAAAGPPVVVNRSRFEVDLNRPRESAVYRRPDDCWGLRVWREELPEDVARRSLETYDAFYATLARHLDLLAARGPFVVFDVHSYNHRRDGEDEPPAPAEDNPAVNVGTGSMDRGRWAPVVDAVMATMGRVEVDGAPLDVRENVRFRGGHLSRWVHERYPGTGCAVALEFKKTFMDEWRGTPDDRRLLILAGALGAAVPAATDALARVPA